MELGVLGPLQVRLDGAPVAIPGAKPRAILSMLGLHGGSVVAADTLVELLWGEDPPRTAAKALQTHISSLRRTLGDGFVLTTGAGWTLAETQVDAARYKSAARLGRDAAAAGDTSQAVARFEEALALWRGIPELPDGRRGTSEKTRWIEGHAALVEDRADALLATGRAAEIIGELEAAVADAPLRERRWGQLMLALYRAGRQGEALGAYQRARALLADELGVDPGPDLRRLEAAIVAQDSALETPAAQQLPSVTRAVTFLLTDIEGSTVAWEADAGAMAVALARHDELVEQVVTSRGGRLIKTRGEGDATFSVFDRPSAAAAAAIELQDAIVQEPWALREPMRIRVALHTGEVELRDGDYFGRAVNRAARLRSLAIGGQILCSGATAELVIDSLPDDVVLADLGTRQLRNLARPEHVFELQLQTTLLDHSADSTDVPLERPSLPPVLAGPGPFVGRGHELERLSSAWQTALAGGTNAMLIAGEPGVGKTRLAGEWSRQAYDQGALVIYGRCDEDLGAPYQPFAEALRSLVPCLGAGGLRGLRGVEALLTLVPGLADLLPDLAAPTRADPDTERYALFDAVVALLAMASASAPVVLILDDLHWAAKPTLLLLRHLLRFGEHARMQIIGTYRSTDLDRSHPLAAMLADLHRDGTANRLSLSGLDEDDVTAYVAEAGYNDEELARALASVTGGNPFFLIEALRHVDESGGRWDQSTLPQGVREAVSRRLSRLPAEANKALAAAAVVGSRFAVDLVERVVEDDLVDAFDGACKAGIVIEEPGGRYRFNHAIVRQSLLAELPSVRRMRLHQRIATTLESEPGADDELLAELAYHYFECAWAGNAAKAVEYCRRAADQAMARLAYEGAADLYDRALHALEEIDEELPDRDDQTAALLMARCEALLAAGDVASAASAVAQLQSATADSAQLAAWATCFDGQLSMLTHPERLDDVATAVGAAAEELAQLGDPAGEAMAHTVRAGCLARLGRIGAGEIALDDALSAARRAREHRRVNAVLANAPLAALWGPNPVPRAGGRCLDVVRLLRITTDSPAVEATSTRCQAVLEAFRGRAAAARRMIDAARRTAIELGLRHSLMEVEQFAGIVELVVDEPAAAEPHLRKAYNGFRRMGLDADTAETAALLGRACLALDRDAEADELCAESERLAGHALKASIAWRTLRARLLSRRGDHDEARRVAEEAVGLAERTDALVDHGDACLTLATVLGAAGDVADARVAGERAFELYERKGAVALAEKARGVLGAERPPASAPPEAPVLEPENACVRAGQRVVAAMNSGEWDEFEQLFAPGVLVESRRKIVGFTQADLPSADWAGENRRVLEAGGVRITSVVTAVRGERLALARLAVGTADASPGAPKDEFFCIYGIDEDGRIALQMWFDIDDIDAAMAELDVRFEAEHPIQRRLENTAARVFEEEWSHFAARDWDALADTVADDYVGIDHRRVVSAETQRSRDDVVRDLQAAADVGFTISMVSAVAIRGERLVLARVRAAGRDPEAIQNDALNVVEIDGNGRIADVFTYDVEDIGAAFGQLDARYLAGEGAPYAATLQVVAEAFASMGRHEFPALAPDCATIDHRHVAAFAPGELAAYIRAGWEIGQNIATYVTGVHRLNDLGAVVSYVAYGNSHEGFGGEWHEVALVTVEGSLVNRCELFNEADLQTAIAKLDQLSRPASRLENAASQVTERFLANFAADDWNAVAETLAEDFSQNDRRRVVGAGTRHGRDAEITDLQAISHLGIVNVTSTVIATRGERLVLMQVGFSFRDRGPEAFVGEMLGISEINADERIVAAVSFDLDDLDAAFEELDRRYLAGEGAAHAHTWTVVTRAYAALNRYEMPAITRGFVSIDHRRGAAFAPGDLIAYVRAAWNLAEDGATHIETVHRVTDLGAIVTHVTRGTSQQGFEAEWRELFLLTVEGDVISRCELFDEEDLDRAVARFHQLSQPTVRLENAASRTHKLLETYFAARDWDGISGVLADDISNDDRRRTVNSGMREGRQATLEEMSATVQIGVKSMTSDVVATRGERLALCRSQTWGRDTGPEAFHTDVFDVFELNADGKVSARVVFDLDDFDAAMAELDARYLAGEAAPYAPTLTVMTGAYAALNRREHPATTPDWVNIDHRRGISFAPGHVSALLTNWLTTPDLNNYIAAVHNLDDRGGVVTSVTNETSREGFEVEWRNNCILTIKGELIDRLEVFDEADLDTALARFEELRGQARRLENGASRAYDRVAAYFAARDWNAMANAMAQNMVDDDRRRMVNAGIRRGRDVEVANSKATAEIGAETIESTVIATRGERLALCRSSIIGRNKQSGPFRIEFLSVLESDAQERLAAHVALDLDDFDTAMAELDARYLAGEAAAYSQSWSVVTRTYAATNRQELQLAPECVNVDHRRARAFADGDLTAYMYATWALAPNVKGYVEAVHRLSNLGAIVTHVVHGTSREGFDAEWREVILVTLEGDLVNRGELFDEADLDTALTRFEELRGQARRRDNAASRLYERFKVCYAARDWSAIRELLADTVLSDDRRHPINSGVRRGPDALIAEISALAEVGIELTTEVIATRGEHLVLSCIRTFGRDQGAGGFQSVDLDVLELGPDGRFVARIVFNDNDFESAIAELDARYLAGEAAAHARTWSVIATGHAALNRREIPPMAPNCVSIDHRRGATFAPGDLIEYFRAGWDLDQHIRTYVEVVHRLTDLGAVCTHVGGGVSREGFDAEWRGIDLLTVEGDMFNRCEVFDEADLDSAITAFDQLVPPAPRLENAASQVGRRYLARFAASDWDAMAEMLDANFVNDDRRRVVGAGPRHGRDAQNADMRTVADLWTATVDTTVVATRGKRIALMRLRFADRDQGPDAFLTDVFGVLEINADERIVAVVFFDLDDAGVAFEELDSRYLKGEAATHSRAWSVIVDGYAALNRHELPPTTPTFANVDHRRGTAHAPGELIDYVRAGWELDQRIRTYPEAVHRLTDMGAVYTHVAQGTSREGFEAEWRGISLVTVDGDLVSRSEVFDEADIDAAVARFEELSQPVPQLENAASRVADRFSACYAADDWRALAEVVADNYSSDDRRRVVGSGVRHGRDAHLADMRARSELWLTSRTSTVMAIRGERLALMRLGLSSRDQEREAFVTEVLIVNEIDADEQLTAGVVFGPDDFDAAFQELEARYLAGEAAAYAHTWSVISGIYALFNRHELPAVDWALVDHRRGTPFGSSDLAPALRTFFDLTPEFEISIETVHRLNDFGAVITHDSHGFSADGLDVEWRMIQVLIVEGDRISRCELFDEADLDAALTRFDQLSRPAPQLANAASRVLEQFLAHFARRDWDAMAEHLAGDFCSDDRRSVINAGIRRGREAEMANWRATGEVWKTDVRATVVATRGQRLMLSRFTFATQDSLPEAFQAAALAVIEVNADNRFAATVVFDPDDIDAAFEELDGRYLAGEAAAHARTWSAIAGAYAAINRRQLPLMTTDFADIDHRRGAAWAPGELVEFLRSALDQASNLTIRIAAVHRLNRWGAVVSHAASGTSPDGFDAEWREVLLLIVDGDMLKRCEVFDDADLGAALARFDELHARPHRLDNAASQVSERFWTCLATRDWATMAEVLAENVVSHDNRRVVNSGVLRGRDTNMANVRAVAEVGFEGLVSTVLAIRGQLLALARIWSSAQGFEPGEISADMIGVVEIDKDNRMIANSIFDADDFDAAFAELEARYIAGEAATHGRMWSLVTKGHAQFNRHELPTMMPDVVYIDHRRSVTIEGADLATTVRAVWDLLPQVHVYVENVHRLTELGAVATQVVKGTSQEGFDAEWQTITIFTFEGDRLSRYEVFDEAELDAALARFNELGQPAPQLENAASRAHDRFFTQFRARNWALIAETLADDGFIDDRHDAVNAGFWDGREAVITNLQALAEAAPVTWTTIAIRGERLAVTRIYSPSRDLEHGEFSIEMVIVAEIDTNGRITAQISFDPEDTDAAFNELDARYLAGEAAAHAPVWSVIARECAAFNRHEHPAVDWVTIDHRRLAVIDAREGQAAMRDIWQVTPNLSMRIETVHRLSSSGAVSSYVASGTSPEGVDAEWPMILLLTVKGDLINRCEIFDEADLEAALARFDELSRPTRRLENAASRAEDRLFARSAAGDWAAIAEILAGDSFVEDRRRVVNVGVWDGRDAVMANMRALAEGLARVTLTVIATRGERLALILIRSFNADSERGEFVIEMLGIVETDADGRIAAHVFFDVDDADSAFDELDARYVAGEAAAHARTWSVIAGSYAAMNRRELFPTAPDWVNIDHRRAGIIEEGGLNASLLSLWQLTTDLTFRIEAVHRLTDLGAVCSHVAHGVSQDGFDAEWRGIEVQTVDGHLIDRCEIFDETDLDAALATFNQLVCGE
ncbi:BTAD domain-containing putative transcriptional regulator [Mycobacterium paraffinicum]|uniref:Cyclase n=1 Tax=Mycobacterium paraffinicum TaxID=53378 RepID=A0ABP8EZ60_9MYCO|nr:BTAD domain-containing putative transcriptional regulator [Mycobacterium paraffinicum]